MKKMFSIVAIAALTIATIFISSCSKKSASASVLTADNMDNQTYRVVSIMVNNQYELLPYTFGQVQSSDPLMEYLQCHVSDPAKSTSETSIMYAGSLVNNMGYQRNLVVSKTDAPTAVNLQFGAANNYEMCVSNFYPPNDLVQAGILQYAGSAGSTSGGVSTTCFSFISASLNGTYKISGSDSNIKLERVQQGITIDILLEKQ